MTRQVPRVEETAPKFMPATLALPIIEPHHVGQARQAAARVSEEMGFDREAIFYIATSVSELANNIHAHARHGTITLSVLQRTDAIGLEVRAVDRGPGISDIALAMQDHYSTNGGLGGGLSGVKRMMDEFEITSTVGVGSRIVARKWQACR